MRGRFLIGLSRIVNLIITGHVNLILLRRPKMKTSTMDIANLIKGFQLSCQTEGKSPKTIEWYSDSLKTFKKFLDSKGLLGDIGYLSRDHIRLYIAYLQNEARKRVELTVERVWLHHTPMNEFAVVYWEAKDIGQVFENLMKSETPFDKWFRDKILVEVHGTDLSKALPMNELLLDFKV